MMSLESKVVAAVQNPDEAGALKEAIRQTGEAGLLTKDQVRAALINGWCQSVNKCLEDGILEEAEEHRLVAFKNALGFSEEDLDKHGAHSRLVKAAVLRDVLGGVIPARFTINETLPINLQKGEKVVWVFGNSDYLEDKTKRTYQGGSRGVSIRVMSGLYYRVGAFKGSPVYSTERVLVDKGYVYITNKHIYFSGPSKSLRVPYNKIVSFLPFDDGIGIVRDAQTAKPQIFKTGDGWFTYNLLVNLAQMGN
jgi:hypothetical protein